MKITVCSDLHLEFCQDGNGIPDIGEGDALILGGDILCARHFVKNGPLKKIYSDFLNKCVQNFENVIYLNGNHEHYSLNYNKTFEILAEHLPEEIYYLENDYVKIKDVIFLGCTLWTNFFNEDPIEMLDASRFMSDYNVIRIDSTYRKLRPEDTLYFHKKSRRFLEEKVEKFKDHKIWICTHHAPSLQSIHEKYKNQALNGAFASNLDDFIMSNPQIKYFSHGHTHESFDYKIGECRVICNPRGYHNGYNSSGLNLNFNPHLQIEI
jgi:predicted phosphodiesterase